MAAALAAATVSHAVADPLASPSTQKADAAGDPVLSALCTHAEAVMVGTVIDQHAVEREGYPFTKITFQVHYGQNLGSPATQFHVIEQFGGCAAQKCQGNSAVPDFVTGRTYLLYLVHHSGVSSPVVMGNQAAFEITGVEKGAALTTGAVELPGWGAAVVLADGLWLPEAFAEKPTQIKGQTASQFLEASQQYCDSIKAHPAAGGAK